MRIKSSYTYSLCSYIDYLMYLMFFQRVIISLHVRKSVEQDVWSKVSWKVEKSFWFRLDGVAALEKWIRKRKIFGFVNQLTSQKDKIFESFFVKIPLHGVFSIQYVTVQFIVHWAAMERFGPYVDNRKHGNVL